MVNIRIWHDTWFRSLSPNARLLFLFLISNKNTHVSGYYEIQLTDMEMQTNLNKKQVAGALKELAPKVLYLENWVCIKNYLRHQNLANNQKVNIAVEKYLKSVPESVLSTSQEIFNGKGNSNDNDNKRVPIPYPYPMNGVSENEEKSEEVKEEKHKFGEFKNVLLTIPEKEKLKELYGVTTAKKLVEDLSQYIRSHGYEKKYKDHYATIRGFARRDGIQVLDKPKVKKEPERPQTPEEAKKAEEMRAKVGAFVRSGMKKMPKSD